METNFTKNTVSIFLSSKGVRTCTVNSLLLHSKYNPVQEAHRNMQSQLSQYASANLGSRKLVVLIGAGLGYEVHAIQKLIRECDIIPIYLDATLFSESNTHNKILYDDTINSDLITTLRRTLRTMTMPYTVQDIVILFWPPSKTIWPTLATSCFKEVRESVELHCAENNTVHHFISQWMRNACFHYVHIDKWSTLHPCIDGVLVIAAGPELNTHIPDIQKHKENFVIIAVSSALQCLFAHNIYPDIIVHQDSSYYASRYLIDFPEWYRPYIAFPLHASRSAMIRTLPGIALTIRQETDTLLEIHDDTTRTKISAHGTVVGSALELGWTISKSKVYLVGFDLSVSPKGTHCHPHRSSQYHTCNRINSFEQQLCTRYYNTPHAYSAPDTLTHTNIPFVLRQDNALKIYSDWFRKWKHPWKRERTVILSRRTLPHYEHIPIVSTLPHMPDKKPALRVSTHTSPFSLQERKKRLRAHTSQWKQVWNTVSHGPTQAHKRGALSDTDKTILELKNTITEKEFHAIVSQIDSMLLHTT